MLSRTTTTSVVTRASSMRRQRRRALAAGNHVYCSTNGCTSYLVVDERAGLARCQICGYTRRVS